MASASAHPLAAAPAAQSGQCACACCAAEASAHAPFEDPDFPARWHTLPQRTAHAAWLRPHEVCAAPRLFPEGEDCSRFQVHQGDIGDCWFMAACAAIADREDLLKQVVPEGQLLFGDGYDGSVRFRLWHLGEWQEVRVDDRLPVDVDGGPVYARCQHKDQFWLPLLEKAFAKFHKHFGVIDRGGPLSDGLVSLTGFSMQHLDFEGWDVWNVEENLKTIKDASDTGGLIVCMTTKCGPGMPGEHAYTVTKVYQRDPKKEGEAKLQLVRVRNPWGCGPKWNGGAWRDGDERWEKLSKEEKETMEYNPEDNGEFWMDMKDFANFFPYLIIGTPHPIGAEEMKVVAQIKGKWREDEEVGGDHMELEKFAKNPQFSLVILGNNDSDRGPEEKRLNPVDAIDVIVELQRSHCRKTFDRTLCIAFYVFEWSGERRLSAEELRLLERAEGATLPQPQLAVCARLRLHPGRRYVVVPATLRPGEPGPFLLRAFTRCARVRLAELPAPPPLPSAGPVKEEGK